MSRISDIIENQKHYDGVSLIERMNECHTCAISVAIVENFEVSEVYAYGVRERETKEAVSEETLFQAGSISKPVFTVAVMRLVEQGILELDKDICEYLIGYEVPTYDKQKHKITLRQILSHYAGLSIHGFSGYQQGQEIPTIEQILRGEAPSNNMKLKLYREPEIGYQYSGGAYILAQKVVTDVCKKDFCELMDELILSPLQMTNSTYSQTLSDGKYTNIAFGYNPHDLQIPGGYNIMPELSAAGLWTTSSDLAKVGIEIMRSLKGESNFLKKETSELMITEAYPGSPYGLGFALGQSKKGLTFGHSGANFGYHSYMIFCPNEGSGIVIMQNSDIGAGICKEITNAFKESMEW